MIVIMKKMRIWTSIDEKGSGQEDENFTRPGLCVIVLGLWTIDGHTRLLLLLDRGVRVISSRTPNMTTNFVKLTPQCIELFRQNPYAVAFGFQADNVVNSDPNNGPTTPEPVTNT